MLLHCKRLTATIAPSLIVSPSTIQLLTLSGGGGLRLVQASLLRDWHSVGSPARHLQRRQLM